MNAANNLGRLVTVLCTLTIFFHSCTNDAELIPTPEAETSVPADETAQLIIDWSNQWVTIDQFTEGMRPNTITRALAYIHLTGYETAVPIMNNYSSNSNRFAELNIDADQFNSNVNLNLALNRAYAMVIEHFMFSIPPNVRDNITRFSDEKEQELSAGLSGVEIESSRRWARHVARRVIDYSETDRAGEEQIRDQTPDAYSAPVGEGLWVAGENEDAWFPYWREVRTFAISPEQSSSTPFNSLMAYSTNSSSSYYSSMRNVHQIAGAAASVNDEELWIAEFWADDVEGLMISPPGRQFSIANQLIAQYNLSYDRALELLLRLGFAVNDAAVSAWDDKYTYNTQRPSTYINEIIDANFTTNLARFVESPNPAFPSYPSGHATFAGAAAGVFINFFGTDAVNFTDRTYDGFNYVVEFRGAPRSFSSFSEMAYENAYSRVPLGVHILEDSDEGLRLGYEIAVAVNAINLD